MMYQDGRKSESPSKAVSPDTTNTSPLYREIEQFLNDAISYLNPDEGINLSAPKIYESALITGRYDLIPQAELYLDEANKKLAACLLAISEAARGNFKEAENAVLSLGNHKFRSETLLYVIREEIQNGQIPRDLILHAIQTQDSHKDQSLFIGKLVTFFVEAELHKEAILYARHIEDSLIYTKASLFIGANASLSNNELKQIQEEASDHLFSIQDAGERQTLLKGMARLSHKMGEDPAPLLIAAKKTILGSKDDYASVNMLLDLSREAHSYELCINSYLEAALEKVDSIWEHLNLQIADGSHSDTYSFWFEVSNLEEIYARILHIAIPLGAVQSAEAAIMKAREYENSAMQFLSEKFDESPSCTYDSTWDELLEILKEEKFRRGETDRAFSTLLPDEESDLAPFKIPVSSATLLARIASARIKDGLDANNLFNIAESWLLNFDFEDPIPQLCFIALSKYKAGLPADGTWRTIAEKLTMIDDPSIMKADILLATALITKSSNFLPSDVRKMLEREPESLFPGAEVLMLSDSAVAISIATDPICKKVFNAFRIII